MARCSLRGLGDRSQRLADFLLLLFENLVLSQHSSVAGRRYDGGTQRLRISIEEEGLVALVDGPRVTPDRLETALSLMAECGMLLYNPNDETYRLP